MLRFLTAGESHGPALTGILEGIPAGLEVSVEQIRAELLRRKIGYGRGDRQKIENEKIEILSGVRFGKTLGSPITLMIRNQDFANWEKVMQVEPGQPTTDREVVVPRPGHTDLAGGLKYGFEDMRNVLERSSARETTMRVALGSIAKALLKTLSIEITSRVTVIEEIADSTYPSMFSDFERAEKSELRVLDANVEGKMKARIDLASSEGDTLGGIFEVVAWNLPVGLGSYVQWDRKLDGDLGQTFLSLNAIKGVEIGMGFQTSRVSGRQAHDEYQVSDGKIKPSSNRSGGLTGGVTTGEPLVVRAAMKPLSTLRTPLQSVDMKTKESKTAHYERSDVCAVPSAAVIGESLMSLVLVNRILEKFGGDSVVELKERVQRWRDSVG